MLMFKDLTNGQKKFVVTFMQYYPTIKTEPNISLQKLNYVLKELADMRSSGGPKIGYPNWLFKTNKVERGLYAMPIPTDSELKQYQKGKPVSAKPILVKQFDSDAEDLKKFQNILEDVYTEEEFNAELIAAGIKV